MRLILTRQARGDIGRLQKFSEQTWGANVAETYLDTMDEALKVIIEHPGLLRKFKFSPHLHFYTVRKHMLVFTMRDDIIYLLKVMYGGTDIETLLSDLEPGLMGEVEIMHAKLKKAQLK